ncbi:hypothetical protein D3C71_1167180 [compost metagenome]
MRVPADQAGDVFHVLEDRRVDLGLEHLVQAGQQRVAAAVCGGQPGHVLRHVPGILPGIAFGVVGAVAAGRGIERGAEAAVALARTHEAGVGVEGVAPVAGARVEGGLHVLAAHGLGHACDGPVVEGVLQGLAGGLAFFIDRHPAQFAVLRDAVIRAVVGGGHHGIQRLVRIETTDALEVGIGDHRHGVVADHAPGFLAVERPHRQHAVGAVVLVGEQRIDEVAVALLRLHQGQQRMQRTVGVPQRESGIVGVALGAMDGVVRAAVVAIAVHEHGRPKQAVVQRGVGAAAVVRGGLDIQHRQRLRPLRLCLGADAVEIEARHLTLQVGDRTGLAHRRNRHRHHQRLVQRAEIEGAHQLAPFDLRTLRRALVPRRREALVGNVGFGVVEGVCGQRPRKTHREIQLPARRPAAGLAETGDGAVLTGAQARPHDLAGVIVEAGAQVQQHARRLVGRIGIAVHADTGAGGQLGAHLGIIQGDRVVARFGALASVAEARGVAAARLVRVATLQAGIGAHRHQQHVAQVGMAAAGEMRVREADDAAVVMAVAGRPAIGLVTRLDAGVRAELDHAERHRGAGIGVPFPARTDERIDGRIGTFSRTRRRSAGSPGRQHCSNREPPPPQRPRFRHGVWI